MQKEPLEIKWFFTMIKESIYKEDKHFKICTQLINSLETYRRKLSEVKEIHTN